MSKKDLAATRLVSKSFAALARPLLFRSCTVRTVCGSKYSSQTKNGQHSLIGEITHRIDVLSSPDISQYVHSIRIYPAYSNTGDNYSSSGNTPFVLDYFFQCLPRFTSLKTLYCENITFDTRALGQLFQLGHLRSLQIRDCLIIQPEIPVERIRIDTVEIHCSSSSESCVRWLGIVQPHSVQDLRLSFSSANVAHVFLNNLATVHEMPLTHLIMPHNLNTTPIPAPLGSDAYAFLKVLTLQVAYVNENLLETIRIRFTHLVDLSIMVYSSANIPATAYDFEVS